MKSVLSLVLLIAFYLKNIQGEGTPVTWNDFLNAKGTIPAEYDSAPSLAQLSSIKENFEGTQKKVLDDLKALLSRPEVLHQIYNNYLVKILQSDSNSNVEKFRTPEREQIFKDKLIAIAQHNLDYHAGKTTWFKGITPFSHLTEEEFKQTHG